MNQGRILNKKPRSYISTYLSKLSLTIFDQKNSEELKSQKKIGKKTKIIMEIDLNGDEKMAGPSNIKRYKRLVCYSDSESDSEEEPKIE